MTTADLQVARLRANPRFRLIPYDEMNELDRGALQPLSEDAEFFGVLVPPSGSRLPVRSVSRDAALVFLTLRTAASVPHLVSTVFGTDANRQLRQLIIDGVLELESDGSFISGESALLSTGVSSEGGGYIGRLSRDAVSYGAALGPLPIVEIASRLYLFNRRPSTPALEAQFAASQDVIAYLTSGDRGDRRLRSRWHQEITEGTWVCWRSSDEAASLRFKLYVSPTLEALPDAFRLTLDALARVGCTNFKAGLTAFGLLRPDKIVAYFARLEDLQAAAELISVSSAGIPAHGVPFTGAIDNEGLVSWGMDPPLPDGPVGTGHAQSWREWVAERVAVYLALGRESEATDVPAFALRRLELDGIDVARWTPNLAIWRGAGGVA